MKTKLVALIIVISLVSAICTVSAQSNEAMSAVKSAKAMFDFRINEPKSAAVHMDVIQQTYADLKAMKKKPVFVVVFMGPSVKLLSKNNPEFSPEIANMISTMAREGIKFEICMIAVRILDVDPLFILPEIKKVDNGWVSEIGYQHKGYSLVPVY